MAIINPGEIPTKDLHQFLLAIVSPRPIAFVSTISKDGLNNLAPFSFFNCFSSNPPILVFSANRRVSDGSTKDTLANIMETHECVINAVSHDIVRQVAVCSCDFESGVSEFTQSGLTPIGSDLLRPPRVAESPASMECKVTEVIPLGDQGGAGNLIICNVLRIHVKDEIINERQRIEPDAIDLMGRMGRTYYTRASGKSIHSIIQNYQPVPVGYEALPSFFKTNKLLTANDLGGLAGMTAFPTEAEINDFKNDIEIKALIRSTDVFNALHQYAHRAIEDNRPIDAAKALLIAQSIQ